MVDMYYLGEIDRPMHDQTRSLLASLHLSVSSNRSQRPNFVQRVYTVDRRRMSALVYVYRAMENDGEQMRTNCADPVNVYDRPRANECIHS